MIRFFTIFSVFSALKSVKKAKLISVVEAFARNGSCCAAIVFSSLLHLHAHRYQKHAGTRADSLLAGNVEILRAGNHSFVRRIASPLPTLPLSRHFLQRSANALAADCRVLRIETTNVGASVSADCCCPKNHSSLWKGNAGAAVCGTLCFGASCERKTI